MHTNITDQNEDFQTNLFHINQVTSANCCNNDDCKFFDLSCTPATDNHRFMSHSERNRKIERQYKLGKKKVMKNDKSKSFNQNLLKNPKQNTSKKHPKGLKLVENEKTYQPNQKYLNSEGFNSVLQKQQNFQIKEGKNIHPYKQSQQMTNHQEIKIGGLKSNNYSKLIQKNDIKFSSDFIQTPRKHISKNNVRPIFNSIYKQDKKSYNHNFYKNTCEFQYKALGSKTIPVIIFSNATTQHQLFKEQAPIIKFSYPSTNNILPFQKIDSYVTVKQKFPSFQNQTYGQRSKANSPLQRFIKSQYFVLEKTQSPGTSPFNFTQERQYLNKQLDFAKYQYQPTEYSFNIKQNQSLKQSYEDKSVFFSNLKDSTTPKTINFSSLSNKDSDRQFQNTTDNFRKQFLDHVPQSFTNSQELYLKENSLEQEYKINSLSQEVKFLQYQYNGLLCEEEKLKQKSREISQKLLYLDKQQIPKIQQLKKLSIDRSQLLQALKQKVRAKKVCNFFCKKPQLQSKSVISQKYIENCILQGSDEINIQ